MTREEAYKLFGIDVDRWNGAVEKSMINCIDKLMDDFESRTCVSCYYLIGEDKTSKCAKGYLPDNLYEFEFGCNKWEQKDA